MELIEEFGIRPRAFAVYMDPTFSRPYAVGRINSRGEVVCRKANRSTLQEAIKEAKRLAEENN
jgi:hypothetical protein